MRLTAFIVLLVLSLVAAVTVVVVRGASAAAQEQGSHADSDDLAWDAGWDDEQRALTDAVAKPVIVAVEGQNFDRVTNARTVKDLLIQMGIVLDDEHAISHDLDAEVVPGTRIVVARIDTRTVTEDTEVPFETTEIEDPSLAAGSRVVQTAGRNGTATTSFLVRYADGIEVLRTEVLSTVKTEPRTEVVRVGTGASGTSPSAPGAPGASGPTSGSQNPPAGSTPSAPAAPPATDPAPSTPKPTPSTPKPTPTTPNPAPTTPKPAPTTPKPTPTTKPPSNQEPDVGAGIGPGTTPSSAKTLAKSMAAARGWNASEFSCLETLWHRESSWNFKAKNPTSTARGIPQAMMSIHFGANWRTDPAALAYLSTPRIQIEWGLNYIQRHRNFSTPCGAMDFWQKNGWY